MPISNKQKSPVKAIEKGHKFTIEPSTVPSAHYDCFDVFDGAIRLGTMVLIRGASSRGFIHHIVRSGITLIDGK